MPGLVPPHIIEMLAVGAMAILLLNLSRMSEYPSASGQLPLSTESCSETISASFLLCLNIFLFQYFAIALSNGIPFACKNEWKPITPRPIDRSLNALYVALLIV